MKNRWAITKLYLINRMIAPLACRLGWHTLRVDICEKDGSIRQSTCLWCMKVRPPVNPRSPDDKRAVKDADLFRRIQQQLDEYRHHG